MSLKRILVIRHAESDEDINPNLHGEVTDEEISLTDKGTEEAFEIAQAVRRRTANYKSLRIYSSPSRRAREMASIIRRTIDFSGIEHFHEPSIRNLDWGNTTPENVKGIERERYRVGVLRYKFPGGDHCPTYVRRIGFFVQRLLDLKYKEDPEVAIIVTHGFALRIIAKFLLEMSDDDFRWIKNPPNCYIADFMIGIFGEITIDKPLTKREPIESP